MNGQENGSPPTRAGNGQNPWLFWYQSALPPSCRPADQTGRTEETVRFMEKIY